MTVAVLTMNITSLGIFSRSAKVEDIDFELGVVKRLIGGHRWSWRQPQTEIWNRRTVDT